MSPVSSQGSGSRRRAERSALTESEYSVEVAGQVGDAMTQLGDRLSDPGIAHTLDDIEQITHDFSTTTEAIAHGMNGVTEQLRAAGYAGPLSGHASVVADRLVHTSRELTRLAEALVRAQQERSS